MSRWANFARSGIPFASSSSEEEWLPVVPVSADNSPADIYANVGVDPRYLYITGDGGGTMIQSNTVKMEQCALISYPNPIFLPISFESNDDDNDSDSDKDNTNNYDCATITTATANATTSSSSSSSSKRGTVKKIVLAGWLIVIVVLFGCMIISNMKKIQNKVGRHVT